MAQGIGMARRRKTDRQQQIMQAGRKARSGEGPIDRKMVRQVSGQLGPAPLGQPRIPGRGAQRVGQATPAGSGLNIGDQLRGRVQSGAITPEQAQRTARDRMKLKAEFGADWRSKLPGGAGAFRQARRKLAENPNNPKLIALNKQLANRRSQLLAAAQGSGQPRPGGQVNPRGRGFLNPPGESPARPRRRRVAPARRAY